MTSHTERQIAWVTTMTTIPVGSSIKTGPGGHLPLNPRHPPPTHTHAHHTGACLQLASAHITFLCGLFYQRDQTDQLKF